MPQLDPYFRKIIRRDKLTETNSQYTHAAIIRVSHTPYKYYCV